MKFIILFLFSINLAYSACDTSISRTNFSANSVLTSSDLNSQFNTVYNRANELPGDCVTDATIDIGKLDTSTSSAITGGIKQGCEVTWSDAATVSVAECYLTIGGNNVQTTTATTVTWGCGSCASEAASTWFYVYAVSTSSGSTLTLLISTTAPDGDGTSSGNKILGRFYNDASQDIVGDSVTDWVNSRFEEPRVYVAYETNNGQTISNATVVKYEDVIEDNWGIYDTSTGLATIPAGLGGDYKIVGIIATQSTSCGVTNVFGLAIYIDGSSETQNRLTARVTNSMQHNAIVTDVIPVAAASTVGIYGNEDCSNTFSAQTSTVMNKFTMRRVIE